MDKSKLTIGSAKLLAAVNQHLHQYSDEDKVALDQHTRGLYALLREKRERSGLPVLEKPKFEVIETPAPPSPESTSFGFFIGAVFAAIVITVDRAYNLSPTIVTNVLELLNG